MIKFIKIYNNKLSLIIVLITESEFLQFNEKVLYNEITSRLCFAELHFADTPKLVLGFISPN
jgi:hypothetical protein